ncbi:UDP-glucose flavonoid 3-O-glucosyltransferase 7-like [Lotus japonicus]|uniref:UDP-glucose flavonoid 3-O-glucosyltransferase 7-like n=1 Tax=Lotus japonicus TaxID=34305 RepID=UPI002587BB54|nr:UDP-glucose flavonoid 3-O-glucosyltransferase 7-like [Lotus japonicus]
MAFEEEPQPLKIYFIPYLAAGHMIPLVDIAMLFASHGHHTTIITTPSNAKTLPTTPNHHFRVHTFDFPSQEVGLPDGVENLTGSTDLESSWKIYQASVILRNNIEDFVEQNPPDCIVADFLYPWVEDLANKLHIPWLVFNGFSLFAICAMEALKAHPIVDAHPSGSFVIPNFPHHITINSAPPQFSKEFMDPLLTVALRSHGFIINSFAELDGEEYVNYYHKTIGHKAWHLGPASLTRRTNKEKAERGEKSVVSVHECLSWLNSNPPNSVLYISFGTLCYWSDKQLYEIASAIEASGYGFIWVVPEKKGNEEESEEEQEKWLPKGFEERNREKGIIIRGWAPQVLILDNPAVGAFITHCGWNSTVEAVCAGVSMITWPLHSEQYYNEKLITEVRGIGVEVGVAEWRISAYRENEKLVSKDVIEKAVRRLMDGGDEAERIRQCAQEYGKKARQAIQEGGSSHKNLTTLIEELKQLKASKSLQ